jgi:hemerythrin-like metal-binding protein
MGLIEWREEYCIGITNIDYEHEKLIEQINSLYTMIDNKADNQLLIDKLGDIYGSISAHFALEEQMMRKHKYVYYEEHKADHERLLDDICDITEGLENTDELDELMFKHKLADWFLLHFKTHDSSLHKLIKQTPHDRGDEPTVRIMIRDAKNKLSCRIGKPS